MKVAFDTEHIASAVIEIIEKERREQRRLQEISTKESLEFDEHFFILEELKKILPGLLPEIEKAMHNYTDRMVEESCKDLPKHLTWEQRERIRAEIQLLGFQQNGFANYTIEELASLFKP